MRQPPFQCLFCGTTDGTFDTLEHPIPESLGNDDTILPKGFVCDSCNQYFGSKVEQPIMASPPFNIERVKASVKTKKHGYAKYNSDDLILLSDGYWDRVLFAMSPERLDLTFNKNKGMFLVDPTPNYILLLSRFLIKVGLELLVQTDSVDVYSTAFDKARQCARFGKEAILWEVGYGQYPRSQDLIKSRRIDDVGPLETRQLYQYELGCMPNGDCLLSFMYVTHCFVCNLSNPSVKEFVNEFNKINDFKMTISSGLMIK